MRNLMARIADFVRESDKVLLLLCFFASAYGCIAVLSATNYMGSLRPVIVQTLCMFVGIIAACAAESTCCCHSCISSA